MPFAKDNSGKYVKSSPMVERKAWMLPLARIRERPAFERAGSPIFRFASPIHALFTILGGDYLVVPKYRPRQAGI